MTSPFTFATATRIMEAMRSGEVSAVELTQEAIAHIQEYDEDINALCVPDFDRAIDAAQEADALRARGVERPLLGVPMTIKESFNVAGLSTTWGIPAFRDFIAPEDAVAVARLKEAGAIILGKTNVPLALGDLQTYNELYGTTSNPWDLKRTAGGSSGGSAAALAAGYGALSLGSDIAGSLRTPAHFCGVYAHKSSLGLVPTRGHVPPPKPALAFEGDLSVVGPMARSAADLALMFRLLAKPDRRTLGTAYTVSLPPARHDNLTDYRVLVLDSHPLMPTSSDVSGAINGVAEHLATIGVTVERKTPLLPDLVEAARLYMRLLHSIIGGSYPAEAYEFMRSTAAALDAEDRSLAAERTRGTVLSHREWLAGDAMRMQHRESWRQLFESYDIVMCPVTPTTAFPHDQSINPQERHILIDGDLYDYPDQLVWAGLASLPGLPATVAPVGFSPEGLPIGVQLIGPALEDLAPIHFAQLLEQVFGDFPPPPLSSENHA